MKQNWLCKPSDKYNDCFWRVLGTSRTTLIFLDFQICKLKYSFEAGIS